MSERYILYTRVSTHGQEDGTSHESQLVALIRHVEERGGTVYKVIRETASGGGYFARPGIREALDVLEAGNADVLCCYDFSRYSRDEEHQQAMLRRVERAGKRLEFTTLELQRDSDGRLTPESALMFGVSGNFAAYHKAKIRADTMRGRRHAAEQGRQSSRRSPLGYHIVTKADVLSGRYEPALLGKYLVVEEEAQWVRLMFEMRGAGASLGDIERALVEANITTKTGASWCSAALSKILSNRVYKGEATQGRTRRVTDDTRLARGFKRDFVYRKRAAGEETIIEAPAIVSVELWERVAALRTEIPRGALGDTRPRYLLSSVLKCPRCGGPMIGKAAKRSERGVAGRTGRPKRGEKPAEAPRTSIRTYACREAIRRGGGARSGGPCLGRTYIAEELEEPALAVLRALVDDPELLPVLVGHGGATDDEAARETRRQIAQIEGEIEALTTRERTLIEAQMRALQSGVQSDAYETMLGEVAREKNACQNRIEELRAKTRRGTHARGHDVAMLDQLRALRGSLDSAVLTPLSRELDDLHRFLIAHFVIEFEDVALHRGRDGRTFKVGAVKFRLK